MQLKTSPAARILSFATCGLTAVLLISCARGSTGPSSAIFQDTKDKISAEQKAVKTKTLNPDQSEQLADNGEALIAPKSMDQALGKFAESLQANPENPRAIFWAAILKSSLKLKGILTRVHPLYEDPRYNKLSSYEEFVAHMTSSADPKYALFLKDGTEDIHTPAELQDWMAQFNASIFETRHALKKIRGSDITVIVPKDFVGLATIRATGSDCTKTKFGPISYWDENCDPNSQTSVGLNRADFEGMISFFSIYQVYLELWTGYRINPLPLLGNLNHPIKSRADAQDFVKSLLDADGQGTLRNEKPFLGVTELSNDMIVSLKYALENQEELCPKGVVLPDNRKGYLLNFGFCRKVGVDGDETERTLATFEAFVGGQSIGLPLGSKNPKVKMRLKDLADDPISDLKQLAPFAFRDDGKLKSLNETPVNRYVTDGKLDDYIIKTQVASPAKDGEMSK